MDVGFSSVTQANEAMKVDTRQEETLIEAFVWFYLVRMKYVMFDSQI